MGMFMSDAEAGTRPAQTADQIREQIRRRFTRVLKTYQEARRHDVGVFASLRAATEYTANEYGNRFLVELLQNAHDAHPGDRSDGEVRCLFQADEGDFGTLYVANRGRVFGSRDFTAICEFAQSSKPPGESIGNKGIGFRSVLQICAFPEIYSAMAARTGLPDFNGYRFTFARPDDIRAAIPDPAAAADALREVSPYSLPLPVLESPDRVRNFAQAGFSTVVRLPVKGPEARDDVVASLKALTNDSAPLLLFLTRLCAVVLETSGAPGGGDWICKLTRQSRATNRRAEGQDEHDIVDLGIADGRGRATTDQYFVATASLTEAAMRGVIEQSVRTGKLPRTWLEWRGPGRVSVAVRTRGSLRAGVLYNHLPMSATAESPFLGHLNAPFYARLDRTSLDATHALNSFLLDAVARLAFRTARSLRAAGMPWAPNAAVDLLAWCVPELPRLNRATAALSTTLAAESWIPVRTADGSRRYAPVGAVYQWNVSSARFLTAERLAATGTATLVDPELGEARITRVEKIRQALLGSVLAPPLPLVAKWCEVIAGAILAADAPPADWDAFYRDIASVFRDNPHALARRALVLDSQKRLLPCGAMQVRDGQGRVGSDVTTFFAPKRERTRGEDEADGVNELRIPAALDPFIAYTHPDITWAEEKGRPDAREFFARHKLVRKFERRELREYLRDLLAEPQPDEVRAAALEFAFRLSRHAGDAAEPRLDKMNLYVPTFGAGWLPAAQACFSAEWATPAANALTEVIRHAGPIASEIATLRQRSILAPDNWPAQVDDSPSWVEFLCRAGVADGLPPEARGTVGSSVRPQNFAFSGGTFGVTFPPLLAREWVAALAATKPMYPAQPYELATPLWHIPGQSAYDRFPADAKRAYTELLVRGLASWPDSAFRAEIVRKTGSYTDTLTVPSPLLLFLRSVPWVARREQEDGDVTTTRVHELWLAPERGDPPPAFVPQLPKEVRNIANQQTVARRRLLDELGAAVWASPEYAVREILMLTDLVRGGAVRPTQVHAFDTAHRRAWRDAIDSGRVSELGQAASGQCVVVHRAGKLDVLGRGLDGGTGETLYVIDERSGLRGRLLEELGRPIFDIGLTGQRIDAALQVVRRLVGPGAQRVSDVAIDILVDRTPFAPDEELPRLVAGRFAWLAEVVALLLDLDEAPAARSRLDRDRVLARLGRVRLRWAMSIAVRIDGDVRPLPDDAHGALAIHHDSLPTIVRLGPAELSRRLLPFLARPIAELIGEPPLAAALELALARLSWGDDADGGGVPTIADLARVLGVPVRRVEAARVGLLGSVAAVVSKLKPVVCYALGPEEASAVTEDVLSTMTAVRAVLPRVAVSLGIATEELLDALVSSDGAAELRDRLGLNYGRFNEALRALAPAYAPFHNRSGHLAAMDDYKRRERERIVFGLRQRYLSAFRASAPLVGYVADRDLASLGPDAAWLDVCHTPSDEMMGAHTRAWLDHHGAVPEDLVRDPLDPVEEVRSANRAELRGVAERFRHIIPAWCHRRGVAVPSVWNDAADAPDAVATLAYRGGWTDFEHIDEVAIVHRLTREGVWPTGMQATTELTALGLTSEDLRWREREQAENRSRREAERQSLFLDGRRVSAAEGDLAAFAQAVLASVAEETLASPNRLVRLHPAGASAGATTRGGGARGGHGRQRPSDTQLTAIGYAGELVALRWLERHYGVEAGRCWKSTYANRYLARDDGNDGLGYDFVVEAARPIYFEVKASVDDVTEFALGETEVRMAQKCQAERRAKYRILWIPHVMSSDRRRVLPLPNPFSRRGAERFRVLGAGMRFGFRL